MDDLSIDPFYRYFDRSIDGLMDGKIDRCGAFGVRLFSIKDDGSTWP